MAKAKSKTTNISGTGGVSRPLRVAPKFSPRRPSGTPSGREILGKR